jgi:hypothetical protein
MRLSGLAIANGAAWAILIGLIAFNAKGRLFRPYVACATSR